MPKQGQVCVHEVCVHEVCVYQPVNSILFSSSVVDTRHTLFDGCKDIIYILTLLFMKYEANPRWALRKPLLTSHGMSQSGYVCKSFMDNQGQIVPKQGHAVAKSGPDLCWLGPFGRRLEHLSRGKHLTVMVLSVTCEKAEQFHQRRRRLCLKCIEI